MGPSECFHPRTDVNNQWAPPRPRHSNVRLDNRRARRWYQYQNGRTVQAGQIDPRRLVHYKTYSSYLNQGNIWIYPCDATKHEVGDGSGNERTPGSVLPDHDEESSSSDEESDSDRSTEDWLPLTFRYPIQNDNTCTSYATTRALNERIWLQRPDQGSLYQLFPDRYLASPPNRRATGRLGGLIGEIPILIALIAYSVRPERVDGALTGYFQQNYQPHGQPRGEGCNAHSNQPLDVADYM